MCLCVCVLKKLWSCIFVFFFWIYCFCKVVVKKNCTEKRKALENISGKIYLLGDWFAVNPIVHLTLWERVWYRPNLSLNNRANNVPSIGTHAPWHCSVRVLHLHKSKQRISNNFIKIYFIFFLVEKKNNYLILKDDTGFG